MNHPHIAIGQEVTVVDHEKKTHKGKITVVYGPDHAQIEFDGGMTVAEYSEEKKPVTFHFEQASPKEEHKKPEAHNKKE